jgi:uncharacterized protein YjbJ (UPF0337 family)
MDSDGKETVMDKNQVKGRAKEVSGTVKEAVGKIVGDEKMEAEGNIKKNVGKVQAAYGDAVSDIKKHN